MVRKLTRDEFLAFRPGSFTQRTCEWQVRDQYRVIRHVRVINYLHLRRFRNVK